VRAHWLLGAAHLAGGDLPAAERHLGEALTRCRGINAIAHEPDILLELARLRLVQDNPAEEQAFAAAAARHLRRPARPYLLRRVRRGGGAGGGGANGATARPAASAHREPIRAVKERLHVLPLKLLADQVLNRVVLGQIGAGVVDGRREQIFDICLFGHHSHRLPHRRRKRKIHT
jgi:hypothetical protein